MGKQREADLTGLAWWLAVLGAVMFLVSTLAPASTNQHLLLAGCALSVSGAATYGLSRLRIRRSRRHDP